MARATQTGQAIASRIELPLEISDELREINFGRWHGKRGDEIAAEDKEAINAWRFGRAAAPEGESIPEVGARLDAYARSLAAEHAQLARDGDDSPRTWALASHAVAIKSLIGVSLGAHESTWGSIWPQPASYSILQFRVETSGEIEERHLWCMGAVPR